MMARDRHATRPKVPADSSYRRAAREIADDRNQQVLGLELFYNLKRLLAGQKTLMPAVRIFVDHQIRVRRHVEFRPGANRIVDLGAGLEECRIDVPDDALVVGAEGQLVPLGTMVEITAGSLRWEPS